MFTYGWYKHYKIHTRAHILSANMNSSTDYQSADGGRAIETKTLMFRRLKFVKKKINKYALIYNAMVLTTALGDDYLP